MSYWLVVFLAILRLVLFFVILFVWIGPKFLGHVKKLSGIDRMLYSWVGIGGILVVTIFLLTILNLYDLIGLFVVLIGIPLLRAVFKEKKKGTSIRYLFQTIENNIVSGQVKIIESIKSFTFKGLKERFFKPKRYSIFDNRFNIAAIIMGITACIIRVVPVIQNAAPFSRGWYFELEAVKNIRLQQYFTELPEPKGMHSLITMFSSLTQVGPELTLSLLGSLTSFLLTIIVFWIVREITKGTRLTAAIFGASIFAIFPTLLLPISLEAANGTNTISLALCFALPTAFIFIRNLRSVDKAPWFYMTMGVLATALTDIFVLLIVLLPFLIYGLLAIPKKKFVINVIKVISYLIVVFSIALSPYISYLWINDLSITVFFESQLLDTLIFSYFPYLIADLSKLSNIYFWITIGLFALFMILFFVEKKKRFRDELVFFTMMASITFLFTTYNTLSLPLIDMDQLSVFYAILLSVLGGLLFYALFTVLENIIERRSDFFEYAQSSVLILTIGGAVFWSGGVNTGTTLPQTLPNGFFEGYYRIINERLPYTYATVSPPIDDVLAQNRHFYMNYEFFLESYGEIDSLYNEYLELPEEMQPDSINIPPASIFIFVEKPPYNSIQQGILFESGTQMKAIENWLVTFNGLPDRELRIFEETNDAIIYEIVNRADQSEIGDILMNIYPKKEGRAAKLFK